MHRTQLGPSAYPPPFREPLNSTLVLKFSYEKKLLPFMSYLLKFVLGSPVALAAEQRAIVGELLEMASVK